MLRASCFCIKNERTKFQRKLHWCFKLLLILSLFRPRHERAAEIEPNPFLDNLFSALPSMECVRPVPNVVLLPCRTQMKLSFRFKHGSSTPFETIKPGTAELGSARLLSTASLAVPHGSSTTCFQTACYRHAELNS